MTIRVGDIFKQGVCRYVVKEVQSVGVILIRFRSGVYAGVIQRTKSAVLHYGFVGNVATLGVVPRNEKDGK